MANAFIDHEYPESVLYYIIIHILNLFYKMQHQLHCTLHLLTLQAQLKLDSPHKNLT